MVAPALASLLSVVIILINYLVMAQMVRMDVLGTLEVVLTLDLIVLICLIKVCVMPVMVVLGIIQVRPVKAALVVQPNPFVLTVVYVLQVVAPAPDLLLSVVIILIQVFVMVRMVVLGVEKAIQ